MTINNKTTLQELIDLGLFKAADIEKFNNKISRGADRAARQALVEAPCQLSKHWLHQKLMMGTVTGLLNQRLTAQDL